MTITLDPTVAGASSNTFGSLDEANAYFATRLGATVWNDSDADTQSMALVTAARRIAAEVYRGAVVAVDQALPFPRIGIYKGGLVVPPTTILLDVKHAQYEEALALLTAAGTDAATDPMAATGLEQFKALAVGDIRLDMRDPASDDASRTLLSPEAYRLLRPYILSSYINAPMGARNVRLFRG